MKRFMKATAAALVATTALGGAAFAGSLQDPVIETPVIAPAPIPVSGEWTGFYTGLQLGYADIDGDGGLEGDDNTYGFHAGYDYDFGDFVLGGELDYDQADIDLNAGAASIDSIARLKLKGGYDLGNTLIYATAGVARADTSVGDETGPFAGLGISYKVTDRYTIGAEVLEHRFDDVGGIAGNDLDATTITLRGSLRF
ncbi:outer membrane beta-barrel protein [Sulfitobacter sp. JBTF-M27]|uniref:Outer membrane beta-barrel protein n=1 Tax=Sulfitobacter sediminilitoris TaxID=2698830 RepID=A0A6P0C994_9RHOB|nr:outer membrane beta-barrel protein [Sulfitobacter sediminilitoris]NEK20924.1 outer membrane beta-barrel protein [Sulfitobacter sediminilitoris]